MRHRKASVDLADAVRCAYALRLEGRLTRQGFGLRWQNTAKSSAQACGTAIRLAYTHPGAWPTVGPSKRPARHAARSAAGSVISAAHASAVSFMIVTSLRVLRGRHKLSAGHMMSR